MAMAEQAVSAVEETLVGLPARLAKMIEPRAPQLAKFVAAVDIDSPLVLSFAGACTLVHLLGAVLGFTQFEAAYFSVPSGISRFRPLSPLSYFRLVSHVFGHVTWEHLNGNMVNLLLVGPACEREFGSFALGKIVLWTAFFSALAHMALGAANAAQLGASGVVFMLILLNSLLEVRQNRLPLTFVVQVGLWVNKEVFAQLWSHDKTSHVAHLAGALVGTVAGYQLHGEQIKSKAKAIGQAWHKRAAAAGKSKAG